MFKAQDYAFQIGVTVKSIFKPDKFGLGLVTDLDFIEKNPFIPISLVLGNFYNSLENDSKIKVDDFIERYYWLMDKTIEELGEDKTREIIEEFKEIVKTA